MYGAEFIGAERIHPFAPAGACHFSFNGIQVRWSIAIVIAHAVIHQACDAKPGAYPAAVFSVGVVHVLEAQDMSEFMCNDSYPAKIAVFEQLRHDCKSGNAFFVCADAVVHGDKTRPEVIRPRFFAFGHARHQDYDIVYGAVTVVVVKRKIDFGIAGFHYFGRKVLGPDVGLVVAVHFVGSIVPEGFLDGNYSGAVEYEFLLSEKLPVIVFGKTFQQAVQLSVGAGEFEVGEFSGDYEGPVCFLAKSLSAACGKQDKAGKAYGQDTFHHRKVNERKQKKQRAASLTAIDP